MSENNTVIRRYESLGELHAAIKDICVEKYHEGLNNRKIAKHIARMGYVLPMGGRVCDKTVSTVLVAEGFRRYPPRTRTKRVVTQDVVTKAYPKFNPAQNEISFIAAIVNSNLPANVKKASVKSFVQAWE